MAVGCGDVVPDGLSRSAFKAGNAAFISRRRLAPITGSKSPKRPAPCSSTREVSRVPSGPPLVASYLFEAVPDGTRLTSRVELQGAGLFGLLEPVIGASLRREMKAALPALKALLESPSGTASPQPTAM